jgi:ribosome biogenesis protein Nip4
MLKFESYETILEAKLMHLGPFLGSRVPGSNIRTSGSNMTLFLLGTWCQDLLGAVP